MSHTLLYELLTGHPDWAPLEEQFQQHDGWSLDLVLVRSPVQVHFCPQTITGRA